MSAYSSVTNGQNDDWDVEQYRAEYECEEHWELKRKFLVAHKDKFPEDELVCLAQVFINVELLGCRYPRETMEVIAELGNDVASDYRERQKNKLQRTFVTASDAASSKVKGRLNSKPTSLNRRDAQPKQNHRSDSVTSYNNIGYNTESYVPPKRLRTLGTPSPYGDIVLVERPGDIPQNILAQAVNASGGNLEWQFDRLSNYCKCIVLLNSKRLAEARAPNQKAAKKEASINGLQELKKYYYTIKIKSTADGTATVTTSTMLKSAATYEILPTDNIGAKLMKLMGWEGGGLGKSEQGIKEPVTLKHQVSKEGLGLKYSSSNTKQLTIRSRDILRKYLLGDMKKDLVFSSDFTNEERAVVHRVARQMGLKSQSYGPKNQRTLVVSRKIDVKDLVEELKSLGGVTDKYQLIAPTL